MGVVTMYTLVSGWCCTEVYRFSHNIIFIYPYSTILALFCSRIPISLFMF